MDMQTLITAVPVGIGIGLLLGLLGGGGSILTVPALVYLLGQDVSASAATSLIIVGANAVVGAGLHYRSGRVRWKTALVFGAAGFLGALPGARLNHSLPGSVVLLLFGGVMALAAVFMFRKKIFSARVSETDCSSRRYCVTSLLAGTGVGFLTGLFGVGGGFLIVPALVGALYLSMPQAVATSLAIIALNSVSGLVGHLIFGHVELGMAVPLVLGGAVGIALGAMLSGRVPETGLRRMFALMLLLIAIFLVAQNGPAALHFLGYPA